MSGTPYADVGFCLECSVQHARDVEHHLEDAVKFSKGDPNRETFQELLDRQRLVRKEVDKLRIQQIMESGEETCISCGNSIEETNLNPGIPEYCEFAKEQVKPKEYFDPKSFRTLCPESPTKGCKDLPPEMECATRVIIGCSAGKFVKGRCQVGTKTHVIYRGTPKLSPGNPHTLNPDNSQIASSLKRIRQLHTQERPEEPEKSFDPRTGQQYERVWLPESLKKELIAEFKRPEGEKTGIAAIKYFNPAGAGTWWVSEYDPEWDTFFGIATIFEPEYGYTSRKELRETKLRMGLWIERDYWWTPKTLKNIMKEEEEKRYR